VSGQVISDNVLATQEILHSMGSRKEEGECVAIKLGMEKAYDLMGWSFIECVMNKFVFHLKFMKLLMCCITEPVFTDSYERITVSLVQIYHEATTRRSSYLCICSSWVQRCL